MLNHMYFDTHTGTYVSDKPPAASYERYIPTYRSSLDIYKETWKTSTGGILYIGYTQELRDQGVMPLGIMRQSYAKKNHCDLISLLSRAIPANKFDEYVERFGLEK